VCSTGVPRSIKNQFVFLILRYENSALDIIDFAFEKLERLEAGIEDSDG
jgi:hypothetical protein